MEVRVATPEDADAIARVQQETWRAAYAHVFPADELATDFIDAERWRRNIAIPPAGWTTFVAGEPVVGFACVGPSRDEHGLGELYALYVHPTAWSRGTGRVLIERAESHLARSYDEATLWVLEDNQRARRFYESAAWRHDGGRKDYERWNVRTPEIRYRKRLSSERSRS
jgi:ribosomal protein S18 acetylase RimI-like enzyme